jgi:hypothetical protein
VTLVDLRSSYDLVFAATKRGDNDYVATCEDGNRYRVYVKDGRVIVEKTN